MFDYIYTLDKEEIEKGIDLFSQVVDCLNEKKLDQLLLKKYKENYFYIKYRNLHQVHNLYNREESKLWIKKHYLLLKSSIINPTFFDDLKSIKDLFICDFENKDYFWLDKLAV